MKYLSFNCLKMLQDLAKIECLFLDHSDETEVIQNSIMEFTSISAVCSCMPCCRLMKSMPWFYANPVCYPCIIICSLSMKHDSIYRYTVGHNGGIIFFTPIYGMILTIIYSQ